MSFRRTLRTVAVLLTLCLLLLWMGLLPVFAVESHEDPRQGTGVVAV